VDYKSDRRLLLTYEGIDSSEHPVRVSTYKAKSSAPAHGM
jgi:hypothetical protein